MFQVSLRLNEVQKGTHDFKYNKVPLFAKKTMEYQYFDVCCHDTSSCASRQAIITAMKPSHTTMYVPSFIKIERGSDGGP